MSVRFCETLDGKIHQTVTGNRTLCRLVVFADHAEYPQKGKLRCGECKKTAHAFAYSGGLSNIVIAPDRKK